MKKRFLIFLSVIFVAAIIVIYYALKPVSYSFTSLNNISYNVPNTVFFQYFIKNSTNGRLSAVVVNSKEYIELNTKDTVFKKVFNHPIYTDVDFYLNEERVASFPVHIRTMNWKAFKIDNANYIAIDKKLSNKSLSIDADSAEYCFVENIPVSGDSMTFICKFMPDSNSSFFKLRFIGKKSLIDIFLSPEIKGSYIQNNSKLFPLNSQTSVNMDNRISVNIKGETVRLGINQMPAEEVNYEKMLGELKGIIISTYLIDSITDLSLRKPEQNCNYLPY